MSTTNDGPGAALIVLGEDGSVADANEGALHLFGVSLEQLKAAPRGSLSAQPSAPAEEAEIRSQWEARGAPDLGGETTIRRPDGREVRTRYVVTHDPAGGYLLVLVPIEGRSGDSSTVYGLGDVLTAWRTAERRLEAVPPGSDEWRTVTAEIMTLRATYQAQFVSVSSRDSGRAGAGSPEP